MGLRKSQTITLADLWFSHFGGDADRPRQSLGARSLAGGRTPGGRQTRQQTGLTGPHLPGVGVPLRDPHPAGRVREMPRIPGETGPIAGPTRHAAVTLGRAIPQAQPGTASGHGTGGPKPLCARDVVQQQAESLGRVLHRPQDAPPAGTHGSPSTCRAARRPVNRGRKVGITKWG